MDVFRQLGLAAFAGLAVTALPMLFGIAFVVRPIERTLAFMRPLTIAAIFAAVANAFAGLANSFRALSTLKPADPGIQYVLLAEVSVVCFLSFVCLSVAWLCVAIGMRRQP